MIKFQGWSRSTQLEFSGDFNVT